METTQTDTIESLPPATPGETSAAQPLRRRRRVRVRRRRAPGAPQGFFQPLPLWVWSVVLFFAAVGGFSANPFLTPFSLLVLPVLASLLWFQGEPPVLLFACYFQWLQSSVAIFYTNFYGIALGSVPGGAQLVEATGLSLIGILVLAAGMRLALVKRDTHVTERAARESRQLQPAAIFTLYLAAFAGL